MLPTPKRKRTKSESPRSEKGRAVSRDAAARLSVLLTRLAALAARVIRRGGGDVEEVHQLRVVSRRADAGVVALRHGFTKSDYTRLRTVLRTCRRSGGSVRDVDLLIASLGEAKRVRERVKRLRAVREERLKDLRAELRERRAKSELRDAKRALEARSRRGAEAFRAEATGAIAAATARLLRTTSGAPRLGELHEVRRRSKRLRFTLEFFEPVLDRRVLDEAMTRLRSTLATLGELTDQAALVSSADLEQDESGAAARAVSADSRRELARRLAAARAAWRTFRRSKVLRRLAGEGMGKASVLKPAAIPSSTTRRAGSSVG